jgi:hypothetical protein
VCPLNHSGGGAGGRGGGVGLYEAGQAWTHDVEYLDVAAIVNIGNYAGGYYACLIRDDDGKQTCKLGFRCSESRAVP